MKRQVSTGYAFTPAQARLDLSGIAGLTRGGLLAVLDVSAGTLLYAAATPGFGASFSGLVLTLQAPMAGLAGTDALAVIFDDGAAGALESGGNLAALAAATGLAADAAATSDGGAFGLVALAKRGLANWTSLLGRLPALGPAAKLASVPVTVASDQVLATLDGNAAAFSAATAMAPGTTYAGARSVGILCTAAGSIVLTLAGGGTIALPISAGWQTFPFATTAFAWPGTGAGAGAVYNLA